MHALRSNAYQAISRASPESTPTHQEVLRIRKHAEASAENDMYQLKFSPSISATAVFVLGGRNKSATSSRMPNPNSQVLISSSSYPHLILITSSTPKPYPHAPPHFQTYPHIYLTHSLSHAPDNLPQYSHQHLILLHHTQPPQPSLFPTTSLTITPSHHHPHPYAHLHFQIHHNSTSNHPNTAQLPITTHTKPENVKAATR